MKQHEAPEEISVQVDNWYLEWHRVDRLYIEWAARYGISDTALWLLQILFAQNGPITQREICARMDTPKQTVSCALAALEKKGIIARTRSAKDRRNSAVILTPSGREWAGRMLTSLRNAELQAFRAISRPDREAFTQINSQLTEQLAAALRAVGEVSLFPDQPPKMPGGAKGGPDE